MGMGPRSSPSKQSPHEALIQFCVMKAAEYSHLHVTAREVAQQVTEIMQRHGLSLPAIKEPLEEMRRPARFRGRRGGASAHRGLHGSAPIRGSSQRGRPETPRRAESSGSAFPRAPQSDMQFEFHPQSLQQKSHSASALGEMGEWVPSLSAAPVSEWGISSFPAFPSQPWPSREESSRERSPATLLEDAPSLGSSPALLRSHPPAPFRQSQSQPTLQGQGPSTSTSTSRTSGGATSSSSKPRPAPSFDSMSSSFVLWDKPPPS